MNRIIYGKQHINEEDIESVIEVLRSDFLTQGPYVETFEKEFAKYVGCKYAVAVSNGTAALHLSTLVLGLKKGEKVITTPITFAATANSIRYMDGEVVFSDINRETYVLDFNKVDETLRNSKPGEYKGIIPVNFAGLPVDLERLREIADKYGLWILEDACHSPGGFFIDSKNEMQKCGSGNYADLSIFSFHPVKHITSGEGGMITTNNKDLYDKLKNYRTHGIQQNKDLWQYNHGLWYYEMQDLGFNYRLTDIQAALGISQLKRAENGIKRRIEIVKKYELFFESKSYILKKPGFINGHAYHLYIVEIKKRDELLAYLRENEIFCQVHYIPLHLMPYYRQFGWNNGDFPNAESYYKTCLSLPIFPTLTDEEHNYVLNKIDDFYQI